ncbi:porin family protein [Flavobacterium daemonense]|uniref:porin family protein n=1 Tax=Flavobacterium daemonense TaxID=1393049 RepID=UPI0011869E6E|nr:porin family protein [Flavobacterium daemonense]KAF2335714.1 porin family protein [Flavobacterium daemonense]
MKKFLLLTLFLYFSAINAQISFEKGYFISNNGTKTACFIKNIDWYNNPVDFKYKIAGDDTDIKTETIATVKEFGVENGATFKRATVKIDQSDNRLENISTTKNPVWKEDTVFLKVLVQGKATLYYYLTKDFARFFYETENIPTEQLVFKEYLMVDDLTGAGTTEENNYFKQQLFNNVKNENTSENEIKRLEYKTESLVKYFLKYNNVDATTIEKTINDKNKGIFHLKASAGVSFTSLTVSGAESSGYQSAKYDNKTQPTFGVEGEYVFPFNKNKWSAFIGLFYQKYEDSKDYGVLYSVNNSQHVEHPSTVKYSGFSLPIGVRHYLFLNQNSKIFVNVAYAVTLGGKFTYESKYVNLDGKAQGNFALGLGYNFKNKISTEIRYNAGKNLAHNYMPFSTDFSSLDLLLSYSIF